jgi:exodeoxyribonuclease V alpha subunit
MTVHKSQGSEFEHTALVLPDRHNPTLTKELLYTAITRSKQQFTLVTPSQRVLEDTLSTKVQRVSGLMR